MFLKVFKKYYTESGSIGRALNVSKFKILIFQNAWANLAKPVFSIEKMIITRKVAPKIIIEKAENCNS